MSGTVFLDRDGTIIVDKHYLHDPKQVELLPRAAEGLSRLKKAGFRLVVVTNQSGVGRGFFDESQIAKVHARLDALLEPNDAMIDAYYYCPHSPETSPACNCRKPKTGMFDSANKDCPVDLANAWMVGDKASDLEFAMNCGVAPIHVQTGSQESLGSFSGPSFASLVNACDWILSEAGKSDG